MNPKPMDLLQLVRPYLVVDSQQDEEEPMEVNPPPWILCCCPADRHAWAPWHFGMNGMPLTCAVFRLVGVP